MIRAILLLAAASVAAAAPTSAFAACGPARSSSPAPTAAFSVAPTSTRMFVLRAAAGDYLAGRARGAHSGVDVAATSLSAARDDFKVVASGGGVVAFARNSDPLGYGHTVIIDHGNGEYSLYAHLAQAASQPCVANGQAVHEGEIIGYVYDPDTGERSSGNAASRTGVSPWERIQVHVELIMAPAGRRSTTTSAPIKQGATISDPTPRLRASGYL